MDIREEKKGEVVILSINGRLDSTNYLEFEKKLTRIIEKNEKNILVDCRQLGYVSSSGLRIFLMGLKKMNSVQGKFLICALQDSIKEIFSISGFTSIFSIYDTQEEALSAF